jgi:hypothetical protein
MNEKEKHYYIEPVEIEIYLKKAGIVKTIIKELKIELIDVEPKNETSREIFDFFKSTDEPIDLIEIQNNFPQHIKQIYDSYYNNMDLYEKLSMYIKSGLSGINHSWKHALNFTELLLKYEPTIAATETLGNFNAYNIVYMIKKLNEVGEKFILEDPTVYYLINTRNEAYKDMPEDKEFNKLVELWEYNVKGKK